MTSLSAGTYSAGIDVACPKCGATSGVRCISKTGRTLAKTHSERPLESRFMLRVDVSPDGCWLWGGRIDKNGYGSFTCAHNGVRKTYWVHRLSYELFVGPILDGLQIDHLCSVRRCVNPAHLEPVTPSQNQMRAATRRIRNTCKKGLHPWPEATFEDARGLRCRPCFLDFQRQYDKKVRRRSA